MPQLVAAIGAVGAAFTGSAVGSFLTTTVVGKLLTSVALSALSRALQSKPKGAPAGIKTSATQSGGTNPGQFILGRYATGGSAVAPAMSHGSVSGVGHNVYLNYVIELSDLPAQGLAGLIIDGTVAEIGTTPHADYGLPILGDFLDRAWVKFYSGTQTAADPMLLAKYADYPDRPWTADMIGEGVAYAILTFRYDRVVFDSLPTVRFVVDGVRLYDPRKDSTAGGAGAHRFGNPATWAFTQNPVVMIYNIMRGLALPGGDVWGGGFGASALPFANWVAAMNACDVLVTERGAQVPLYRAGLDVAFPDEPAGVIEELLLACNGQMVDMGGVWKIRAGGPGLPMLFFSDDDVMASRPEDFDPFPAVTDTYNGITATYPEPGALWEPKEAAPIYRTDFEDEDGGRRLVANLQFASVTSHRQVRNIMRASLRDHRRMRRHNNTLGPVAMAVEPLDVVAWTSARNGYSEKSFEVGQVVDALAGLPLPQLALREVDASDYDPSEFDDSTISRPPGKIIRPGPRLLRLFEVAGVSITDGSGNARRPALRMTWAMDAMEDVDGIEFEIRRTGTTDVIAQGVITNVSGGQRVVASGILPSISYQARARLIINRARAWTGWATAVSPNAKMTSDDMSSAFLSEIEKTAALAGVTTVSVLPAAGDKVDQIVMLVPPGRLYRWTGTAWTTNLFAGIEPGSLDIAAFANSIRPVELLSALPGTGNFNGRMVYRTSDKSLWRHNGTAFINTNAADQIVGELTAGQIAAASISARELAANSVTITNLAIGDLQNLCPDPQFLRLQDFTMDVARASAYTSSWAGYKTDRVMALEAGTTDTSNGYRLFSPANIGLMPGSYYAECYINLDGTVGNTEALIRIYVYNTAADGTRSYIRSVPSNVKTTSGISLVKCQVDLTDPAENTLVYCYQVRSTNGSPTTVVARFNAPSMRRMNAGELTVEGSIRANHLAVETLLTNSAQIGALIVNNTHLTNATITTAKIADAAISTAKIGNAAITTSKIGDLQVDTIKIKDNAVTIPANSYAAGTVDITSATTEVTLATVVIVREAGFTTRVTISLGLSTTPRTDNSFGLLTIYRGGTALVEFSAPAFMYDWDNYIYEHVNYTFVDANTSSGSTTYALKATKGRSDLPSMRAAKRFIEVQQTKK